MSDPAYVTRRREAKRRHAPRGHSRLAAATVLIVIAALVAFGLYRALGPIAVTVDGRTARLARGTTVGTLLAGRSRAALWGDFVAVDGRVLKAGGGKPPAVTVDGARANAKTRLDAGDVVSVARGADTTEPLAKVAHAVEASTTEGSGGYYALVPVREILTVGKISRVVVARQVEYAPRSGYGAGQTWTQPPVVMQGKVVALTFDDGPNPIWTPKVLAILEKAGVKATFFMLGAAVARYPALAAQVAKAGHTVGNHSYYHLNWDRIDAKTLEQEMRWTSVAIEKATGRRPIWLRPPGGRTNPRVFAEAKRQRLSIVLWDADTNDWQKPSPDTIAYRALSGLAPGAVILMHDSGGDRSRTVAALPKILWGLKERGYRAVTIDQLYGATP